MDKYRELIDALNSVDTSGMCPCEMEALCEEKDCIVFQAADAIEELTKELRKEQGKVRHLKNVRDKNAAEKTFWKNTCRSRIRGIMDERLNQ